MRINRLAIAVATVSLGLSVESWCKTTETTRLIDDGSYFFISGRYIKTDEDRSTDRGGGYQAGFALPLRPNWGLEASLFTHTYETKVTGGTDFYHRGGGLDLVYTPGDRRDFTPFLLVGLGAANNDVIPNNLDKMTIYGNVGLGLVGGLFDTTWLRGRIEARAVFDRFQGTQQDYIIGAGLEIPLGLTSERVVREEINVPVEKTIVKTEEKIVYVDRVVPSVSERIIEKPVERIVEKPVERIVEKVVFVTPSDSDNDNIPDSKDLCPGTPTGLVTDNRGCVLKKQVFRLENIEFDYNTTILKKSSEPALDKAAEFLRIDKAANVQVAGHTDNKGSKPYNLKLSLKRANTIRDSLISRGIEANRLSVKGYGSSQPLQDGNNEFARSKNRRVELRIQ